jgi:hypothetical protein
MVAGFAAHAASPAPPEAFDTVNCFSWNGGAGSAGAYSKCVVPYSRPGPVAAPVVTERVIERIVQVPPVILQPECPVKPAPKPKMKYKKPAPKYVCPVPMVPKAPA